MKKKMIALAATAGLAFVAMNAAHAADGTINVTGSVVASTCKINGGQNDLDVPLPRVGTNSLSEAGMTAGRTPFKFDLTECGTGAEAPTKVSVHFEPGANVNLETGRLVPIGAGTDGVAQNVEIGILNDKYEAVKVGAVGDQQNSSVATIDGTTGAATLEYSAEYNATGVATAGSANSSVQYSLSYP